MMRWMLIFVLAGGCVGTPPDSLRDRNIEQVLVANCIDSEFVVVGEDEHRVVVVCDGSWRPWQSTHTDFAVAATLRSFGLAPAPAPSGPQSSVWHSGADDPDEVEAGARSLLQGKIYGLTGTDRTFVILHKR